MLEWLRRAAPEPKEEAEVDLSEVQRAPARVLTSNQHLGPHRTPAAALRWNIRGTLELNCLRSGWLGPDLLLELGHRQLVTVPLRDLRVEASGIVPAAGPLPRGAARLLMPELESTAWTWWELPITQGMTLELTARLPKRAQGYRDAAKDEVLVATEATLHVVV